MANDAWTTVCLLAQQQGTNILSLMWPILLIFLFAWLILIRPQQQERKRHQAMLAALKKNDRVITVGGIYGVVTNVHREADEITVKVDEAANVKIRVTVGSIARVLSADSSGDSSSK